MRDHPPMKETEADRAVTAALFVGTGEELRQIIERVEQLEAEKAGVAGQIKDIWAEAKGRGYDTKVIRQIVKDRRRKPDDLAEEQAVLELYRAALGMA